MLKRPRHFQILTSGQRQPTGHDKHAARETGASAKKPHPHHGGAHGPNLHLTLRDGRMPGFEVVSVGCFEAAVTVWEARSGGPLYDERREVNNWPVVEEGRIG